jgi:hypothetical protein
MSTAPADLHTAAASPDVYVPQKDSLCPLDVMEKAGLAQRHRSQLPPATAIIAAFTDNEDPHVENHAASAPTAAAIGSSAFFK